MAVLLKRPRILFLNVMGYFPKSFSYYCKSWFMVMWFFTDLQCPSLPVTASRRSRVCMLAPYHQKKMQQGEILCHEFEVEFGFYIGTSFN